VYVERLLPTGGARTQHVQEHPGNHGGQPAAQILYGLGSAQSQPRFLDGVVASLREPSIR
jgi:hypothetical protein